MGNLIGYIRPGMKRMCNVEISQTPTQWNSKCSKLFNLKADGDTTNKKFTTKELEKSARDKRTAVKATSKLQKKSAKRALKRTLPSAHKAWLLRTRTHGGFVVMSLCEAWGLRQLSNMLHWLKTMFEDLYALSCTTLCWKCVQYIKKKSFAYVVGWSSY